MSNTEVIEKARVIFPNGINNLQEEKRLIQLLNFYKVPWTKESLYKILNVNLHETTTEVKQEA